MKRMLPLIFFLSIFFNSSFGQWTLAEQNAKKAFEEHFAPPRESIFLHLNKSDYVLGENIWFKAYIYNRQKKLPFRETTNLYVGLYNSAGRQISKKLFRASDGHSHGSIELDSSITVGDYYIKASTNWMRNFKEEGAYIQKIRIYAQNASKDPLTRKNGGYDVQFLPEGGLIAGIQNNVGVKCIGRDGRGAEIVQAIVRNPEGTEVARFSAPRSGMTSFTIQPQHGVPYSASITFREGKKGTYLLPRPTQEGYNISLVDVNPKRLLLVVGRGKTTKEQSARQKMVLWISRDGLAKKLSLDFKRDDNYSSQVIDKTTLHKGMNIFTLLDTKGRPILERLYYNHQGIDTSTVEVVGAIAEKDSIAISIVADQNPSETLDLSISVLPKETIAYEHQNNILSTFLLEPYLSGHVEDPSYYFRDVTSKKMEELDLLLLIQGWSSYDWEEIYSGPPKKNYPFEQGVELFGRVQSKVYKGDKLMVYPFDGFPGKIIELDRRKPEFSIPGLFPEKGKEIKFSMVNSYDKVTKPKMFVSTKSKIYDDRLSELLGIPSPKVAEMAKVLPEPVGLYLPDNTIELPEVTLIEKRKRKRFSTPFILENKLTKVTEQLAKSYPNMLEIIRDYGFIVYISYEPNFNKVQITSRRNAGIPIIYIDDVRLVDLDKLLYDYPLTEVDSYYIDRTGDLQGGGGGVIRIYTKENGQKGSNSLSVSAEEKIFQYAVRQGFDIKKRFYVPKYRTYGEAFRNFGAIHWEPRLTIHGKGTVTLKVPETGTEDISLFIEGMGMDGNLISTIKTVKVGKRSDP